MLKMETMKMTRVLLRLYLGELNLKHLLGKHKNLILIVELIVIKSWRIRKESNNFLLSLKLNYTTTLNEIMKDIHERNTSPLQKTRLERCVHVSVRVSG